MSSFVTPKPEERLFSLCAAVLPDLQGRSLRADGDSLPHMESEFT